MFRPVEDPEAAAAATARASRILDGARGFSREWLEASARVAVPEETGLHLDADQRSRLVGALRGAGVTALVAVAAEPLRGAPTVFTLDASDADLAAFSHECGALAFVLLPRTGDGLAVLCSTLDYLLVAGPRPFVSAYAGDLSRAREAFLAYVEDHVESARPALRGVVGHFDDL